MINHLSVMIMSGLHDGDIRHFIYGTNGIIENNQWRIRIGRVQDNDLALEHDRFISRYHAEICWRDQCCWLVDCNSSNGTFMEDTIDLQKEIKIEEAVAIDVGQLFRVGETWMRIYRIE